MPKPLRGIFRKRRKLLTLLFQEAIDCLREWFRTRLVSGWYAAALNRAQTGNLQLFLTLLGGGAFGNLDDWIFPAMQRALELARGFGLEIYVVSRTRSNPLVQQLIETFQRR